MSAPRPSDGQSNSPGGESDARRVVAELTELVSGLAHELRNPLSTLMVNLTLLAEDLRDANVSADDMRRRALLKVETLRREAERLQSLFDDLLSVMGPQRLEMRRTNLAAVVDGLATFFEPSAHASGISLGVVHRAGAIECPVDEKLLRQALLNLLINAQEAMPAGGTLTVETASEDSWAVIAVRDTGPGIDETDQERIFQPFVSTKSQGSGLGLSITRRIVERHGGSVRLTSRRGQGTTFTIQLPLTPPKGD